MISQQEWISQMEEITGRNGEINLREWIDEVRAQHDSKKPFAPENGETLKFKVGDTVIYTNSYGVTFQRRITGISRPDSRCARYEFGARYFIDSDSPWVPVSESSLRLLDDQHAEQRGGHGDSDLSPSDAPDAVRAISNAYGWSADDCHRTDDV